MSTSKNDPQASQVEKLSKDELSVLTDSVIQEAKAREAQHLEIADRDPHGVYRKLPKGFKASDEGRNYDALVDMSHSIKDWLNNGGSFYSRKNGVQVSMGIEDAAHSKDFAMLFPTVVQSAIIEHIEPLSNIKSLYQVIRNPTGAQLKFPIWGPSGNSINLYVGETGEPNSLTSQFSGSIVATTGKYGIRVSVTDEVKENSVIDLYRLQIMWAGEAINRFEEKVCVDQLFDAAENNVLFDNEDLAANSTLGHTHGRDASGFLNGTLSQYDWFEMVAYGNSIGADPSAIIMHPLMWRALLNNSLVRDRAAQSGGSVWNKNTGNPGIRAVPAGDLSSIFSRNGNREMTNGVATNATFAGTVQGPNGAAFTVFTTPFAPIRKAISVDYNSGATSAGSHTERYVGDMLFIDPRDVGFWVVDKELYVREETRLFQQFTDTAMFAKAGTATSGKSRGLFKMKGIVATEGYDLESTPVQRQLTGALDGGPNSSTALIS